MSRVVASLLALIAAMFGQALLVSTVLAATPEASVYVYDGDHHTTAAGYTTTERGPPSTSPGFLQKNGNTRYVMRGPGDVGVDAKTGLPTNIYTVIRKPDGSVLTMFPGTSKIS